MRRVVLCGVAFVLALSAAVSARVIYPAGWSKQTNQGAYVFQSPPAADGAVVFLIAPGLEKITAKPMSAWFDEKVRAAIAGQPSARIFMFGYQIASGRQLALIISPMTIDKSDPRILTAMDTVADGWKGNEGLSKGTTMATSQQPGPAPAPAATPPSSSSSGGNCREEMMPITTWTMQQVCSPSAGGFSNCHLESTPVQQRVLQTVCR
jgi:hypothetical protein